LPRFVVCAVQTADAGYGLQPAEAALLGPRANAKRREEFRLGRAAAHEALRKLLGGSPGPVLQGERGEPLWPPGVVGAIAHAQGVAAAVVAKREDAAGVGLDLESSERRVDPRAAKRICRPAELAWVNEIPADTAARMLLLFSAKESVYKAVASLRQRPAAFNEIELRAAKRGMLLGRLVAGAEPAPGDFEVGYLAERGFVVTFAILPPSARHGVKST
jgi:4'-phosphopantetheinyl transferase EntD